MSFPGRRCALKNKVLFVVNGLGMGNSTRCYSLIQELHDLGFTIEVATSGNGLLFFRDKPEVGELHAIGSIHYGKDKHDRLAVLKTFFEIFRSLKLFLKNGIFLTKLIRATNPGVVVYDSQYSLLPPLLTGVPLVALNNADKIVTYFLHAKRKPLSIYPQFLCIEWWDYLFHKLIPDEVLSPWTSQPPSSDRFRTVGLVVRRGITPAVPQNVHRVLIMLSGSTFGGSIDPSEWNLPYRFDIVGREGTSRERVTFHGRITENLELLRQADVLIINAGFSAVSEAIALRKPTIVIPVENHAEQWVNAQLLAGLGLGIVATQENVKEQLESLVANYAEFVRTASNLDVRADGAHEGALRIRERSLETRGLDSPAHEEVSD